MGFNISSLNNFTLEDSGILIAKSVLGSELLNYVDVRPGYPEGSVAVNLFDLTPGFTGASCGWTSSGSTNLTQITVANTKREWKQSLCLEYLRTIWASTHLDASAMGETLPFEDIISDLMVKYTREDAEAKIGAQIITQVTVANGAAAGPTGAWSSTTAYDLAQGMVDALPLKVQTRDDLMMFMSRTNFRYLQTNIVAKNLFHYNTGETIGTGMGQSIILPGTNIRVVPVSGFGTSNRVICGPAKHVIVTLGAQQDTEGITAFFSKEFREMKLYAGYIMGVGVVADEFSTNDLA